MMARRQQQDADRDHNAEHRHQAAGGQAGGERRPVAAELTRPALAQPLRQRGALGQAGDGLAGAAYGAPA